MNQRSIGWICGLLLGTLLAGCDRGVPLGPEGAVRSSVEIDLRALHLRQQGGMQQACHSVVDEAVLDAGGTTYRQAIPPGALSVMFEEVEVETGQVRFAAEVRSNNDALLYTGQTTQNIQTSFDVTLSVDQQEGPILQVCPGELALNRENGYTGELQIRNAGTGTLAFEALAPEEPCGDGPCLDFEVSEGEVEQGQSFPLFTFIPVISPQTTLEMRVTSAVGDVAVPVAIEPIPDVVVTSLAVTGTPEAVDLQRSEVPVEVVVRNAGSEAAGLFKVALEYTEPGGNTVVGGFQVPGQESSFYPFTPAPLEPGAEVTFSGTMVVRRRESTVTIHAVGDSCSSDELMPAYCRVDEFDEFNNESEPVTVVLP